MSTKVAKMNSEPAPVKPTKATASKNKKTVVAAVVESPVEQQPEEEPVVAAVVETKAPKAATTKAAKASKKSPEAAAPAAKTTKKTTTSKKEKVVQEEQVAAAPVAHKKILRDNIQGLTKPALRRLARRAGVKRVGGLVFEDTRHIIYSFLDVVIHDSIQLMDHCKRKTINANDVVQAAHNNGRELYGY